jgi:hypothetical protein
MQVECEPADDIAIKVSDYRASEGGWIRLVLRNVAGDAGIVHVELSKAMPEVSILQPTLHFYICS